MNNETATIKDLSNINSTNTDDINHKSKENNATVDKTDKGYLAQLKGTFDNMSNTVLESFKKINALGVKAPITLNLTELNKDIEYDQEDSDHIRKIRSTNKIGSTTSEYESKIFTPTLEDQEFIKNEKALLENLKHPILDTYAGRYYEASIEIINNIYYQAKFPNKESGSKIFIYVDTLSTTILPFLMQINQFLLLVEDNKGKTGIPTKTGIKFWSPIYKTMHYTVLENLNNCTKTINISLDIMDKLQKNHQELFKDAFQQEIMVKGTPEIEEQKKKFSYILSCLKPFNSDLDQDLNKVFSLYRFEDQKKIEYFSIFNATFYNKEEAKKCYRSMNKEFLSQYLNNFDLYKYFESIYPTLRSLNTNYQSIHNKLFGNVTVEEDLRVMKFNYYCPDRKFHGLLYLHWNKYNGQVCPEIRNLTMPSSFNTTQAGDFINNGTVQPYLNTTQVGEVIKNGTIGSYRNNSQTVDAMNNGTINATQLAGGIGAFGVFVATLGFVGKYLYGKYYSNNQAITDEEIVLKEEGKNNSLEDMTPNPNATLLQKNIKKGNTAILKAKINQDLRFNAI